MDYLSAEYVICFMVCDCDIVLLLSDQCGRAINGLSAALILLFSYSVPDNDLTVYILSGMIFTVISAFILYFITGGVLDAYLNGSQFSTYYISLSIFLAYALTYPDMKVLLYFVIPIKMKWMAIVYAALVVYDIVRYFMGGAWFMALPIIASLLNFIIFFLGTRNLNRYNPKEIHRRNQFKRAMGESKTVPFPGGSKSGEVTKHKCAVCGRTEKDDPNLEFRFCSKCNGNYEYCQDHLYTHIHKK